MKIKRTFCPPGKKMFVSYLSLQFQSIPIMLAHSKVGLSANSSFKVFCLTSRGLKCSSRFSHERVNHYATSPVNPMKPTQIGWWLDIFLIPGWNMAEHPVEVNAVNGEKNAGGICGVIWGKAARSMVIWLPRPNRTYWIANLVDVRCERWHSKFWNIFSN